MEHNPKLSFQALTLAAFLALVAAFLGYSTSYQSVKTPRSHAGDFKLISADGWVQNGAQLNFPELASRGNRLILSFDAWRPAGTGAATLRVSVCGKVASEFTVTREQAQHLIHLTGRCEPRLVSIQVLNPFTPAGNDQRELGVKLISARVVSVLRTPIIAPQALAKTVLALLAIGVLLFLLPGSFGWAAYLAVLIFTSLALGFSNATPAEICFISSNCPDNGYVAQVSIFNKLYAWWLAMVALLAGFNVAARLNIVEVREFFRKRERIVDNTTIVALLVVLAGGLLRFYGLNFGLPSNYHPDEVPKINAIMRMVEGHTLDPQYFLHPSLLLYLTYFTNSVIQWLGVDVPFRDSAFLAGRLVSAIAGTLSIYLTYAIGRRLYNGFVGVTGAMLLAVFPLHVTCSRYLKEDALLTFMVLSCVLALIKAVQEDKVGWLLSAGFLAGVATSSKYSGLLTFTIICAAPFLKSGSLIPDGRFARFALLALALMPAGFVFGTPYSVLNHSAFLHGFASESHHMQRGHGVSIGPWAQYWMYHFWRSILPGLQTWPTLAAVAGAGVLLWRRRMYDLFVIALILLFYLPAEYVRAKAEPQPERYILPCLPFLAIAAGEFLRNVWQSNYRIFAPVILTLAFASPLWRTLELASEIKYDTRQQMAEWMIANLPPGAKVSIAWKPYSPNFRHHEFQVSYPPRGNILEYMAPTSLKQSGEEYFVLSNLFYERYFVQPLGESAPRQRIREVFERVPIVHEIRPRHGTYGFHNPRLTVFSLKPEDFARLEAELEQKRRGEISETSNEKKTLRATKIW